MPINISIPETTELKPRISVIGVGGAGGNAVNNMIESALEGVEFIVANTDAQAVTLSKAQKKIQLGVNTTQGLGAGSMPNIGCAAAEESIDEILEHVGNSHMLFITAGMGGGTGTGAAPVIAQAAKEKGILTVGVITKPFHFEGARRMRVAMAGIEELQKHVDTLLIIPNQNLFSIADERTTFHEAFAMADEVLHSGVRGITDLMVMPGLINLDFADVRTVMGEMGQAMMGTGEAEGEKRAIEAAEAAISNPLLDKVSMKGARGVLINITGSMDMKLFEIDEAANRIRAEVDPDANIIIGSTFNQELEGKVRVSVVATGIDVENMSEEGGDAKPVVAEPSVAVRPWRGIGIGAPQGEVASAETKHSAFMPAPKIDTAPEKIAEQNAATSAPLQTAQTAQSGVAKALHGQSEVQENPVGDVQARIRRLLTEGDGELNLPVRGPVAEAQAQPSPQSEMVAQKNSSAHDAQEDDVQQGSNPFRGRGALGVAVGGLMKSLGGGDGEQSGSSAPQTRSATASTKSPGSSGDLFEDDLDTELEIPAFLRKKKTG